MIFDFNSTPKFCISLKRSEGRRSTVSQEFARAGIKDVKFFAAVDKNDLIVPELSSKKPFTEAAGVLGCALSHISIIKHAKQNNYPAICVFEDDVIFCDDFMDRIKYIESLPNFRFDIFSLGGHFEKEITPNDATPTEWKNIMRTVRLGGTYGYIMTSKVYDFVLRNYQYNYGADEFYGNFLYRHFNSYAFVPFLVGCRPCQSEITGQYWEYENIKWHYQQTPVPGLI
jgi:glycosyl transferase, family 25